MEHLQHCLGFRHGLPEASVHGHFQAGFKGSPKDLVSWLANWVCLKIGLIFPNEIAIFHRDNDQQNHWV